MVKPIRSCQICSGNLFSEASYLNAYGHILFQNKVMLVCRECGFGRIHPKIKKSDLSE